MATDTNAILSAIGSLVQGDPASMGLSVSQGGTSGIVQTDKRSDEAVNKAVREVGDAQVVIQSAAAQARTYAALQQQAEERTRASNAEQLNIVLALENAQEQAIRDDQNQFAGIQLDNLSKDVESLQADRERARERAQVERDQVARMESQFFDRKGIWKPLFGIPTNRQLLDQATARLNAANAIVSQYDAQISAAQSNAATAVAMGTSLKHQLAVQNSELISAASKLEAKQKFEQADIASLARSFNISDAVVKTVIEEQKAAATTANVNMTALQTRLVNEQTRIATGRLQEQERNLEYVKQVMRTASEVTGQQVNPGAIDNLAQLYISGNWEQAAGQASPQWLNAVNTHFMTFTGVLDAQTPQIGNWYNAQGGTPPSTPGARELYDETTKVSYIFKQQAEAQAATELVPESQREKFIKQKVTEGLNMATPRQLANRVLYETGKTPAVTYTDVLGNVAGEMSDAAIAAIEPHFGEALQLGNLQGSSKDGTSAKEKFSSAVSSLLFDSANAIAHLPVTLLNSPNVYAFSEEARAAAQQARANQPADIKALVRGVEQTLKDSQEAFFLREFPRLYGEGKLTTEGLEIPITVPGGLFRKSQTFNWKVGDPQSTMQLERVLLASQRAEEVKQQHLKAASARPTNQ